MKDAERNLQLDQDQGVLKIGSLRYLLLKPETLSEIQKGVEDRLGPKSAEYLYAAGASWAVGMVRRLKAALPEDPEELARALCHHATKLGWGRWELLSFQPEERELTVRITDSPFAEAYGQSYAPVCHLIAGAVAGLAEALYNMPATGTEQRCKAQGADTCVFVATGHDLAGSDTWCW